MIYTVHHTSSKENGETYVKNNVPFQSVHSPSAGNQTFLGTGYYFWDYNLDYAKVWGEIHYGNDYFVSEYDVYIRDDDELYLDIAGNRKHMLFLLELMEQFNLIHEGSTDGIDMCFIIEYLKGLEESVGEKVFPFNKIRILDYKTNKIKSVKVEFKKGGGFTFLNPRIILYYEKKVDIMPKTEPFIKFAS